ncbi:MAG: YqeG family HAD IIIA-type phosphatase [Candidatus Saganbacteria bacterium]|nr:YqeG family HAD IIIA-type phosphatase [Candidatus Saganbacteria bacterium]
MFDLGILRPNQYLDSIQNIDFAGLKEKGIKGLLFDIDDTIIARRSDVIGPMLFNFFENLKDQGFSVLLLSNNFNPGRVERAANELKLPFLATVFKPLSFGYKKALRILNLHSPEVAVIGDQLFMDILGGNRMEMHTVLVKPISREIAWYRKIMRFAEQWVLSRLAL